MLLPNKGGCGKKKKIKRVTVVDPKTLVSNKITYHVEKICNSTDKRVKPGHEMRDISATCAAVLSVQRAKKVVKICTCCQNSERNALTRTPSHTGIIYV